jgi:predicted short-subunit dehydrogenase-like oxidoreductase (DUF2520 family)
MRELERDPTSDTPACTRLAIVGGGRLGTALTAALSGTAAGAGLTVLGPYGRDGNAALTAAAPEAVLLCVPDQEIARAAAALAPGPLVGHCSGATGLDVLAPHEAFSLHPLMTVTAESWSFAGAGAAVAGSTPHAAALARSLACRLGMVPVDVADGDRAIYHAAASIASNFLVTLEAAAERLAEAAGADRALLVPLVRATVENWAALGPRRALTGPVARGDDATVKRQREAIAGAAPDLLELFDALVAATRRLAAAEVAAAW